MGKKLTNFYGQTLRNFFEAIFNLTVFLPYFFSITNLFKTLFYPWKNLYSKKTKPGFSFDEWMNRFFFNSISRVIGFFMRLSIIFFYFLIQVLFFLIIPPSLVIFFFLIPFIFILSLFEKTEEEIKNKKKTRFVNNHLTKTENTIFVEQWFEDYYHLFIRKQKWWKLNNLFTYPPLARDWSSGYTPVVDQFCDDLTSSSYQLKTKNIIDREKEIDQIERILSKANEANVFVVGEDGVGKHTIVDALAKRIYEGQTATNLVYKRVLKLNMEKIATQFTDQKQRENFLEELFKEIAEAKNVIVFIDDIDKYLSYGEGRIDMSGSIEKFARSQQVQIIGITTPFFYQKFLFPNDKINRFFSKVDVFETTKAEAEKILLAVALTFEKRYNLIIPFEVVKDIIDKSDFYITYIPFPEKAIDLLDSVCVYSKERLKQQTLTSEAVDAVLMEKTHIPTTLTPEIRVKLVSLERLLSDVVIYQDQAITKISDALRRSFLIMGKRKSPLASFLFLGPTGVGKTETAKTIAKVFFGSEKNIIRLDMSFYQSKEDIPKLVGSSETASPGILTTAVRENPYGVLLLDEIEKANHDLLNIFLTLLDEGYFCDGYGRRVDCKNLVVIATSNGGSDYIYRLTSEHKLFLGGNNDNNLVNYLVENKIFSPEFLNRFDGVVIYNSLNTEAIINLAQKMITKISTDVYNLYRVKLAVSDVFIRNLAEKSYDQKFGARNMERLIRDELESKVAKIILENKAVEGQTINI